MNICHLVSVFSIILIILPNLIQSQQPYIGLQTTRCDISDTSRSIPGYSCNGRNRSCQAYLTFRSAPRFNSVSTIAALLSADPDQISQINSVPRDASFELNRMVLVPVDCSCSGQYYQHNSSHIVQTGETYLAIANNTFQSLTTCQALQLQNGILPSLLQIGSRLSVPLRCACPTQNQTDLGFDYLLSYLVSIGENLSPISSNFGVDDRRVLEANMITIQDNINPFTTLLIPLENPPTSNQTTEPPPPPPSLPPPTSPTSSDSNRTWVFVLVGILGGLALLTVIGLTVFCLFFKKKKKNNPIIVSESFVSLVKEKKTDEKLEDESEFLDSLSSIASSLKIYTFKELLHATDEFSPDCLIKGSVYRGTINGDLAAIKKMNGNINEELNLLNKINHLNLIRLSGVCFNQGDWYLVYEYAVNGPLSDWIYSKKTEESFLNWLQRIQIALDVANGINYLHSYTSPPCIHKDLKASNVLLDGEFRAKIANFTLARSADSKESVFALTKHIIGTKGYMAPEYLENGLVSPKLDVYSFGVLMVEILTGREIEYFYKGENTNLLELLSSMTRDENGGKILSKFIDPHLQENYPADLALFMVSIICGCLNKDPSGRSDMKEVVQNLSRIFDTSLSWESSISVDIHA